MLCADLDCRDDLRRQFNSPTVWLWVSVGVRPFRVPAEDGMEGNLAFPFCPGKGRESITSYAELASWKGYGVKMRLPVKK